MGFVSILQSSGGLVRNRSQIRGICARATSSRRHNLLMATHYVLRALHLSVRRVAIGFPAFFPIAAVKRLYGNGFNGVAVDAAHVDADAVRMRAGNVEGFYSACGAEKMLRDMRVEGIRGERFAAADQFESIGGYDQMQISVFAANRTIAVRHFQLRRRDHLEADSTAMTAAGVCGHVLSAYAPAPRDRRSMLSSAPGCPPSTRRQCICRSRRTWGRCRRDSAAPVRRLVAGQCQRAWNDRPW